MKWIDTADLELWAKRHDSKANLPHLISKLIRATTSHIDSLSIPSGRNVYLGGWDGIVEISEGAEFIPEGISLWEIGTNRDKRSKANSDLEKRTSDPLNYDPSSSTFVFVTPYAWQNKDEWIEEKLDEGIWKDIRVIDGQDLESWIELAPSVGVWLASLIKNYPTEGIQAADNFWEEWSQGENFVLPPSLLTSGREDAVNKVKELIANPASIIPIQAPTREESLAFVTACFKQLDLQEQESLFSRSVIVDTEGILRSLSYNRSPLIILPRFGDIDNAHSIVARGHHLIMPLGVDDRFNGDVIKLPRVDREGFRKELQSVGFSREKADDLSKETGRNITILRRQLGFDYRKPIWSEAQYALDLLPALLVGRWDESFQGDKEVVSALSGVSYEQYIQKLARWKGVPDSPVIQIGEKWKISSTLDGWTYLSGFSVAKDISILQSQFLKVLREVNPALDLEADQRGVASIYGKKRAYSSWIREGLTQSLILIAVYGDKFSLPISSTSQIWADNTITSLLQSNDSRLWCSLDDVMPLVSEASPSSFLASIENHLSTNSAVIEELFEEGKGFITPITYHTGLLWALEGLAWFPELLSRVTLILGKLSAIDPGGSLQNRPINSLRYIFLPWLPQTNASLNKRFDTLQLLINHHREVAWKLLLSLLPEHHAVGHYTHKHSTRWRKIDEKTRGNVTYEELFKNYEYILDQLLSLANTNEDKLAALVSSVDNLAPNDRKKLLSHIHQNYNPDEQKSFAIWNNLREVLHTHNSSLDTDWVLPKAEIRALEELYDYLRPTDITHQYLWLFDDSWLKVPEGVLLGNYEQSELDDITLKKRKDALLKIYDAEGLSKIVDLINVVQEPEIFGDVAAIIIGEPSEIATFLKQNIEEENYRRALQGFVRRKYFLNGLDWTKELILKLQKSGLEDNALSHLLIPLPSGRPLWDFVHSLGSEVELSYWRNCNGWFYALSIDDRINGIQMLQSVNRHITIINSIYLYAKDQPTNILIDALEKAITEKSDELITSNPRYIQQILLELDKREDVEEGKLPKLEWLYLPLLAGVGSLRKPVALHSELSTNADFFVEVLSWLYRPSNEKEAEKIVEEIGEEVIANRAKLAFDLLQSWKVVPGVDVDGNIDRDFLRHWVYRAREIALQKDRLKKADLYIGKILAEYPESDSVWPPEPICEIIEEINTTALKVEFRVTTSNKRSSSVRGSCDGGDRERKIASYFRDLSTHHSSKFPVTASLLEGLAKSYEARAKEIDKDAEARDLIE